MARKNIWTLTIENCLLTASHYSAKEILKRFEQRICFNTYIYAYIRIVSNKNTRTVVELSIIEISINEVSLNTTYLHKNMRINFNY